MSLQFPAPSRPTALVCTASALLGLLAGCSGGGGSSAPPPPPPAADAQVCAPTNPYRADALEPTREGTLGNEKAWLASYLDSDYLWYREMLVVNPAAPAYSNTSDVFGSLEAYFYDQLTPARTASGQYKDRFSFVYPTAAWQDLIGSGIVPGYGVSWSIESPTPPRGIRVAMVEPGSPAALAGLVRGDVLVSADGTAADVASDTGVARLNAALFPKNLGETHVFVLSRGGVVQPDLSLASAEVAHDPVPQRQVYDIDGRRYGYLLFNDHVASSEPKLIEAITYLRDQGVQDLVLDLRYNGGGYLFLASELAYMVAGPTRTAGKVFERLVFNDKRSADNVDTPFYTRACGLAPDNSCTDGSALPTLNLPRVSVIATGATCSASESIVNGLRGVGVEVRLIGGTTCGKPYGFAAQDNCGISYFPIEFKGENALGYGDYGDGMAATCAAADDLSRPLGDPQEGMLQAAVHNLSLGSCNVLLGAARKGQGAQADARPVLNARLLRGPERETRVRLPAR